jgi:hypothetical protein
MEGEGSILGMLSGLVLCNAYNNISSPSTFSERNLGLSAASNGLRPSGQSGAGGAERLRNM